MSTKTQTATLTSLDPIVTGLAQPPNVKHLIPERTLRMANPRHYAKVG